MRRRDDFSTVMSIILTIKGRSSILSTDFQPPIDLNSAYGLALLSFHSYNSIPNIEKGLKFYLIDTVEKKPLTVSLPEGSYEITDLENYIRSQLPEKASFTLKPNNNTLKCEIYSDTYSVDFQPSDSIGDILGFSKKLLKPKTIHNSDLPVNIIKVRTIHIDTNITSGAFYNNRPAHTLYEFAVGVDPGFAIDETPHHLIYLPVIKNQLHNITLRVLDQNFKLVNFRNEEIIIRLELRPLAVAAA